MEHIDALAKALNLNSFEALIGLAVAGVVALLWRTFYNVHVEPRWIAWLKRGGTFLRQLRPIRSVKRDILRSAPFPDGFKVPLPPIAKISGDRQVVTQHHMLPEPLVVQVTNDGAPVAGIEVRFFSEPPSAYVADCAIQTDQDGKAAWRGAVHGPGEQFILAAVSGAGVETFSTRVASAGENIDGDYAIDLSLGQHTEEPANRDRPALGRQHFILSIREGRVAGDPMSYPMGTIGFDGSLTLRKRVSLDDAIQMTGALTINARGQAKVAGTCEYVMRRQELYVAAQGTWTGERR